MKCRSPLDSGGERITNPVHPTPFSDPNAETLMHYPHDTVAAVSANLGASASLVGGTGSSAVKGAAEFQTGDMLAGRYRITKLLGEGGMGAVYQALDTELDRPVALKLIRPELASQPDLILRFKNELILARQITHRNVVRIFDIFVSEGAKFMTMEFVEGVDLHQRIANSGKLPVDEAVAIFRQALLGLQAAHNEGVVHRDLKPHNIVVDPQGRAVLMDFGIASSAETSGMTRTGMLMGTPYYMAPEQALGQKADARSDLFSMGVIFFEMLTGSPPYQASSSIQTLVKRTTGKAPSVLEFDPDIPVYLAGIVARCLEIGLDQRYPNAAAILADLDAQEVSAPGVAGYGVLALQPNSSFGTRYLIEAVLGQGGMGTVYKARDLELERPVALKLVRAELASKPASFERLKQEILLASSISHRNILRIHDLGEVDGLKFVSMAYVDGTDLAEILRAQGPLPIGRAIDYAIQICEALQAAHGENVVHRDLKPRNVLISKDDRAFITDFGVAFSLAAEGVTDSFGTPEYMAPEQVEGKTLDHRVDLYSFGLILYQMATGALPFQADTTIQTLFQRVTAPPRSPKVLNPELPDALSTLILKCLERDPEMRYQSATDILEDLRRIQKDQPLVSDQPAPAANKPKVHRGRWVAAACVAAALILAAAIPQARNRMAALLGTPKAGAVVARYVAVIPMRVPGDDPALSLIADGLVDTLSTRLAQLSGVHLASPTAAARVNPREPLARIAQSLGARLIVQGEVSGTGDKVQIAVTINEPDTGRRLWTHAFSGFRQDILTIQDQVFQQTAAALDLKLSSEDRARAATHPTEDVGAYGLYLSGRNLLTGVRDQKNLDKSLGLFQSAIDKDANFALAYTGLADASRYMYDLTKDGVWTNRALGAATHAQQLNDNLPEVHFALGSIYDATGKTAQAIAELNRALQLAPNSDEAYRRIGRAYSNAGRKAEALANFQKAIDTNPYYWLNYNLLGIALVQSGDNERALQAFKKVTEVDPSRDSGWSNIGFIDHNLGKWDESVSMYKKAVELAPSAANYTRLGVSVFFLGRCDEAKSYYDKALALNPGTLTLANLADADRCLGQKAEAAKYYQLAIDKALRALQVNPRDASTLGALGEFYAKKGDVTRGLEFTRRALALDSKNAQILYQGAVASALGGDKRRSLELLTQAIQNGYSRMEAASDRDLKLISSEPEFKKLTR